MTTVMVDSIPVAIERSGTGPPILLVHGLGGPPMWERVIPILSERFDVLLPHLPGFGDTPAAPRPLTAAGHAAVLARLLDQIGVGRTAIAGISYGGEIAARLAASRGDLAASLTLISPTGAMLYPAPLRSTRVRAALRPLLRRGLVNARIADALSRRSFHDPGVRPRDLVARHLERLRLPGRLDALLTAIDEIWSGDGGLPAAVAPLALPLTLIWGEEDRTVPLSSADRLRASRPDADLVVVRASGHSVPLERPAELSAAIAAAASRTFARR